MLTTNNTEAQLTLLAEKILTPLSELISTSKPPPKPDETKEFLLQLRQEDKNEKNIILSSKDRLVQEETEKRERHRQEDFERLEKAYRGESKRFEKMKLDDLNLRLQEKENKRQERIKQEERRISYQSLLSWLYFLSFLAICLTLMYVVPKLNDVLIAFAKGGKRK
jgi:hypothetical protein